MQYDLFSNLTDACLASLLSHNLRFFSMKGNLDNIATPLYDFVP